MRLRRGALPACRCTQSSCAAITAQLTPQSAFLSLGQTLSIGHVTHSQWHRLASNAGDARQVLSPWDLRQLAILDRSHFRGGTVSRDQKVLPKSDAAFSATSHKIGSHRGVFRYTQPGIQYILPGKQKLTDWPTFSALQFKPSYSHTQASSKRQCSLTPP